MVDCSLRIFMPTSTLFMQDCKFCVTMISAMIFVDTLFPFTVWYNPKCTSICRNNIKLVLLPLLLSEVYVYQYILYMHVWQEMVPLYDNDFLASFWIQIGFSINLTRKELRSLRHLVMCCLKGIEKQFRTPIPCHVSSFSKQERVWKSCLFHKL